jgi:hypothetical protein
LAYGQFELRSRVSAATFLAALGLASCSGTPSSPLLEGDGSAVHRDAGTDAAKDTGPAEAAPPHDAPSLPGVQCGESTCSLGTETCCREGTSTPYTLQCTAAGACSGLSIPCADAADCAAGGHPGYVCCGEFDKSDMIEEVGCVAPAACKYKDYRVVLCDPTAVDACPTGETCETSSLTLRGFNLCLETDD